MIRRLVFLAGGLAVSAASASNGPFETRDVEAVRQIIDAIYRLDYEKARAMCSRLHATSPEDPLPDVFRARTVWQQEISRHQALGLARFGAKDFFAENQAKKYNLEPDKAVEAEFLELSQRAIEKAKSQVRADSRNLRAWFLLGLAYQNLATFNASFRGGWREAFLAGENTRRAHKRVFLRYPDFADCLLSQAVYDYVAGSVNWFYKMWGFVLGIRGDQQRGLSNMERAANESVFSRPDARTMLVLIYTRENRYEDALRVLGDLSKEYPENCLIPMDAAVLTLQLGRTDEAIATYAGLVERVRKQPVQTACPQPSRILNRLGIAYRWKGDLTAALTTFDRAVSVTGDVSGRTRAQLERGKTLDLMGRRAEAVQQYELVRAQPDTEGSAEEVELYLKKPYRETGPRPRSD